MLWTIGVLLVVTWMLGLVTQNTLGGFIHVFLLLAIISVLISDRPRTATRMRRRS